MPVTTPKKKLDNCLQYLPKKDKQPLLIDHAKAQDLRYSISKQNNCLKIPTTHMKREDLEKAVKYYGVKVIKKPPVTKKKKK